MKAINKYQKTTQTGKTYWLVELEDGRKASAWEDVPLNVELNYDLVQKGNYLNLVSRLQPPKFIQKENPIKQAQDRKEQMIYKAQDRKEESISYFNSCNSAIQLITANPDFHLEPREFKQEEFIYWRDFFIGEYQKWNNATPEDKLKHMPI